MSILDDLLAYPAYGLIRVGNSDTVTVIAGARTDIGRLADIPVPAGAPAGAAALSADGGVHDNLVLVPFAQVRERGFEAHDDGTPLTAIACELQLDIPFAHFLELLPEEDIEFEDRGGFETDDEAYAQMVGAVIRDEIGNGEGANLVIGRNYRAKVADWGHTRAWSVLRRLMTRERGAHWTFCLFTGDRFLIGASPERHVSVDAGQVQMNPISGTFRLRGLDSQEARQAALLEFLRDEKEIYELFMVVDEELKMMCDICNEGGLVLGPFLKPMTHLVHTEYVLTGRTSRDLRDVLRDSMFAATVTGSPVENACRLIKQYEPVGRGYYGSLAALVGRDAHGNPRVDAPILIRTADVDLDGNLKVTAGATLVRDSDPAYETAETHAKAGGILSAFGLVDSPSAQLEGYDAFTRDPAVLKELDSRNARLSQFWLSDQSGVAPIPALSGKRAVIVDGEDDFVTMLAHILGVLGVQTDIVRHADYRGPESVAGYDLVLVGPGPGDPRNLSSPKIATMRSLVDHLLEARRPFLAVCLGHQVLAGAVGLELAYKDIVFQGTQSRLKVRGQIETVGFYNTFVARVPASGLPEGIAVEVDPGSGDIHTIAGPHYRGVQFHAESILTQDGYSILRDLVQQLLV